MKGAAGGDVGRVDQLLASEACGVDDKFSGRTALHAASQNGHYDVVRCLVRYNANIEEEVRFGDREGREINLMLYVCVYFYK